ncbi:hypothetical protein M0R04_06700 [Candidatus Dojkabacteria bacterium]|jgi:hypothetical protein|nr:hypothetical protein [Candidatus Dojkabacteria bacterium]
MSEEIKIPSAVAGSGSTGPAEGGQTGKPVSTTDNSKNYEELEKKLGEQGNELGEYRTFIEKITPLLNKLETSPDLVKAIMDGKIDQKLISAVLDGKVKIEEAQQVAEAHDEVKKEMGKEAFDKANIAEIEKRIVEKVTNTVNQTVEQHFRSDNEQKEFENHVTTFIANTKDFPDYADRISTWLNDHPDQDDIEVAYHAVKGIVLAEAQAKANQVNTGDAAKDVAANAGGVNAPSAGAVVTPSVDPWDQLVSRKSNPNSL